MTIDKSEVKRYLGYKAKDIDPKTQSLIDECVLKTYDVIEPKSVIRRFKIKVDEKTVDFMDFQFESRNLAYNLRDCDEALLMVATLGSAFDVQLKRYLKMDMVRAVVWQACGAAAIEAYCDELVEKIGDELVSEGRFLRPRFSPGYGDLALTDQPKLLGALDADKYAGVVLNEGMLMYPEKSVSAVIGITKTNNACILSGCEQCSKHKTCSYSRV